jgi:hypothetical protein
MSEQQDANPVALSFRKTFPAWLSSRLSDMYENAQGELEPFGRYTKNTLDTSFDVASMGGRFS